MVAFTASTFLSAAVATLGALGYVSAAPVADVESRGENIATYFYQGGNAGNCGQVHQDSDYICAITTKVYGSGQYCGKKVHITNENTGKSITAMVADSCPSCATTQSIDLSVAAFKALASLDQGIFPVSYKFID